VFGHDPLAKGQAGDIVINQRDAFFGDFHTLHYITIWSFFKDSWLIFYLSRVIVKALRSRFGWKDMDLKTAIKKNSFQLGIVVAIFLFMIIFGCAWAISNLQEYMADNAEEMLLMAEERIERELWEAKAALSSIGVALTHERTGKQSQNLAALQDYLAALDAVFSKSPGHALGYQDTFWYLPGEGGGTFVSALRWEPPEFYEAESLPWYHLTQDEPGTAIVTPPYRSLRSGNQIITVALLLPGEAGEEYGFLGIDLDLRELVKGITSFRSEKESYGFLIGPLSDDDRRLGLMAYPDPRYELRPLESLGPQYVELEHRLDQQTRTISSVRTMTVQGNEVVAFYRGTINGWYIGLAFPQKEYYSTVYVTAAIYAVTGLIMMLILCYFLLRLSIEKIQSDEENRAKSSFLAQVSHEIRTPLNSILGMSEIILRKDISADLNEDVSIIKQAGNILLSIINTILDFSKIETNKIQIESKPYHLASMLNDVINIVRLRLMDKQVDFFVNLDSDIPAELIGDEVKIRQILINLLNNAIKYTKLGHIRLNILKQNIPQPQSGDNQIKIVFGVEDTGIGIKQEDLTRLFNEFTRLDLEHNQDIEGTGLGLAIAGSFCRAMGGGITVTSTYGRGSVFTATVLQGYKNPAKIARLENPATRVLLYEDRPAYLQSLLSAFSSLGPQPQCAPDLETFKRDIQESKFDYAFIPSRYAADCISCWRVSGSAVKLVVMLNSNDMSGSQLTGGIHLPVHSGILANILNGVTETKARMFHPDRIHFTAPDARILVVDDLPTNLRIVEELLKPYGMKIDTSLSGSQALDLVRRNHYDLVFMDHMMPEMDGLVATDLIRKQGPEGGSDYFRNLPIVMLTANAVAGQREMFLSNGVNDFLSKPIDVGKLNTILETWLPVEKRQERTGPEKAEKEEPEKAAALFKGGALPALPGIDTQTGLRNAGGSVSSYISILSFFHGDIVDRIPRIKKAAVESDFASYTTMVHAIKGAARSIGALEAGDLAAELEIAGRNRNSNVIVSKTGALIVKLEELAAHIRHAFGEKNTDEDSPAPDQENRNADISGFEAAALDLGALKNALLDMDTGKANTILSGINSRVMGQKPRKYIAMLEQHILLFEYVKAVELIDELLPPPPPPQ
jgi:signal transduction histidine kinase/CheY-like chemotaxis protein/HPt (histidine-containing phosphotransfer) domain-containing protein